MYVLGRSEESGLKVVEALKKAAKHSGAQSFEFVKADLG